MDRGQKVEASSACPGQLNPNLARWFEKNGFQSWQIAIGDVTAAGHWLVAQGSADSAKLGVFGWSYGGCAALQSAVTEPELFKSVIAVAPVTDPASLKEQYRNWSKYELVSQMVGDGAHMHEGSPAEHADRVKVPILMFQGGFDRNVSIEESKLMCSRVTRGGGKCELVTWEDLDHYLDDSSAAFSPDPVAATTRVVVRTCDRWALMDSLSGKKALLKTDSLNDP